MARGLGTRSRFAVAYLLLGAAVGTGLGIFIVLLREPPPKPAPPWSSWSPPAATTANRAREIADHVSSRYRLASGRPLNRVVIGIPEEASSEVRAIGIPKTLQPRNLGDFELYDQTRSMMYLLCGAGKDCKIAGGKPTVARGTVLRREALELALYTLKYASPVDNVVVFIPPRPEEKKLSRALFFRRQDLESELSSPLKRTLPHTQPPLPGKIDPTEKATVDELTGPRLYRYRGLANATNFGSVVVLQPAG